MIICFLFVRASLSPPGFTFYLIYYFASVAFGCSAALLLCYFAFAQAQGSVVLKVVVRSAALALQQSKHKNKAEALRGCIRSKK